MYKIKRFSIESRSFTRAEKQAFKELYKKTEGFRKVPESTHPRDVFRFQRLAEDISNLGLKGDVKNFDRENAKTLFKNLGMDKSAGQVDKVLDKYTNKRALARLAHHGKIKASKNDIITKSDNGLVNWHKAGAPSTGADLFLGKTSRSPLKGMDITDSEFDKAIDRFNEVSKGHKADKSMMDKLEEYAKSKNIKVEKAPGALDSHHDYHPYYSKSADGKRRTNGGQSIISLDSNNLNEAIAAHEIGHKRELDRATRGLTPREYRDWSSGRTNGHDTKFHYLANKGAINSDATRRMAKLENKSKPYKMIINDGMDSIKDVGLELERLADEKAASSYGSATLKKLGASKSDMEYNKRLFDAAYDTYLKDGRFGISSSVRKSLMNKGKLDGINPKYVSIE